MFFTFSLQQFFYILRGYNGPGGWAFKPVPGEPEKTIFIWIMDTDLKVFTHDILA